MERDRKRQLDQRRATTVRELERLHGRRATRAEQSELLWALSRAEREPAMYRGELTLEQCCEWAARRPAEVPKLSHLRRHAARPTRASKRDSRRQAARHSWLPIDPRATLEGARTICSPKRTPQR